jgi:hypothetical protein
MTEISTRLSTIVISCPVIHGITELASCKKCPYHKGTIKKKKSNRTFKILCSVEAKK